jgi:hypothetical protein
MCTWNINGSASLTKRLLVDAELNNQRVMIGCVQETHLWGSHLETPNYVWILGPQLPTQSRASRGLGFLVSKAHQQYVDMCTFYTPNIGLLRIRFPFAKETFNILNVHKYTDGHPLSAIETGVNINTTLP